MNLLIVDDEPNAIQTVIKHLRWEKLGFDEVFTASNKAQAIEKIQQNDIEIMLCDIEMPMGSGLELLEWTNENEKNICCVFMTCHAEFSYAQKAMRLGSCDYILKPLDFEKLENVLSEAVKKVTESKRLEKINSYWLDSRKNAVKQFWKDFFVGDIAPDLDSVRYYWQRRHMDFSLEAQYLPILLCVKHWTENLTGADEKLFLFAIRNIADELFSIPDTVREVIPFSDNMVLVMLCLEPAQDKSELDASVKASCDMFTGAARIYYKAVMCCYVGEPAGVCDIPEQLEVLQTMDFNNVMLSRTVMLLGRHKTYFQGYTEASRTLWPELWRNKRYALLLQNMEEYLNDAAAKNYLNRKHLEDLSRYFQYLLYEFANTYNIFLDELFGDDTAKSYAENSVMSIEHFLDWVKFTVKRIEEYERENIEITTPVEKAKLFIKSRLSEDLPIEEIASHVRLNADYLNRIFKREEGVALNKYVTGMKMEKAKWLMQNTDTSIGDIAAKVGYYNYSSFNRVFSKATGMPPLEYKTKYKQLKGAENE